MAVLAFSYRRFSSPGQAKGSSLERQMEPAREYAAEHGLELDESLVDRGLSAYSGAHRKKGDLGRFLKMVESGRVPRGSFLLIDEMSRLSRMTHAEAAGQLFDLVRAGIRVVTLNDRAVYDDKIEMTGLMMAVIKIDGAHNYSKELARKVSVGHSKAKKKAREEGVVFSRTGPSWLRLSADRKVWTKLPDRVAVVQRIYEMADARGMGTTSIAIRLNQDGVQNFKGGSIWHDTTIIKILRSPAAIGHYQPRWKDGKPDGDLALNYFPPIIDEAVWYRVQSRLDKSKSRQGSRPVLGEVRNLFYSLTRCACGHNMVVQRRSKDKVDVFQCYGMMLGRCENRRRWKAKIVEDYILNHVRGLDLTAAARESEARRDLAMAEGRRDEINGKIERLLDQMEDGDPHVGARLKTRRAELAAADKRVAELRRLVEREGLSADPADHQAKVTALRLKLAHAEGAELYDFRARIAVAAQELISAVVFHGEDHIELQYRNGVSWQTFSGLASLAQGKRWPEDGHPEPPLDPTDPLDAAWLASHSG